LGSNDLNLNIPLLRDNRQEVWITVIKELDKMGWTKRHVEAVLSRWEQKHDCIIKSADNKTHTIKAFYPYRSIVIYMLRKKLRQGSLR
jgi:hypothetical protein